MSLYGKWLGELLLCNADYEIYRRPNGIISLQTAQVAILDFDWSRQHKRQYLNDLHLALAVASNGLAWRLYETKNGLRAFIDTPFGGRNPQWVQLCRDLKWWDVDEQYLHLCEMREACAARLTPKEAITGKLRAVCNLIVFSDPLEGQPSRAWDAITTIHDQWTLNDGGELG